VLSFKNSYRVKKQLHNGMYLEKANERLLSADTDQSDFVPWNGHSPKLESEIPQPAA